MKVHKNIIPKIIAIYALGFFFSLHVALPTYLGSNFLSQFVPEKIIGVIFSLASILTIVIFAKIPAILKRFGNTKTALTLALLNSLLGFGLAFIHIPIIPIILFILNATAISLTYFTTDIFLEHSTKDTSTGKIRGIYLFFGNLAWIISQVIVSYLIIGNDYGKVYLASAIAMIPVIVIIYWTFSNYHDVKYKSPPAFQTIRSVWRNHNLAGINIVSFLLQFFYAWMVIYSPIYLHNHIGLTLSQTAIIFSVMLLPFIITQIPLGRIADKYLGEKEILVVGFTIMAIMASSITFISSKSLWVWILIFFLSRIGASAVEIMSETYFFKKVKDSDANYISLYRATRPWAYMIAPLIATVFFFFADFEYLFLVLGILMIVGVRESLMLEDTK